MNFEIELDRFYPHPIERVWRALTDSDALGEWLMENDFVPEPGRVFTLWCENRVGGTDTHRCMVRELDPPRRMLWSWVLEGGESPGETTVEFRLEPVDGGTRLWVRHSGELNQAVVDGFRGGWPVKLEQLEKVL